MTPHGPSRKPVQQDAQMPAAKTRGRLRWWIVWTLFFSTVTNYISRQTFSVLSPVIVAQFHFTHAQLATVLSAFQLSYAVTWLVG